ncbi:Chaperone DnaJ [Quillaja saponaria]|uniref:Chaperone DnaJ n=1 Tax=Quillaja saponaria TaxID=32244 RepID=A0AAD7LSD7_QUISA|nr:Chaperone DnaJ [Quillaja saponaria]
MTDGEEKGDGFYAVLGLKKECTSSELRNAYKKLALKWHPDRCSSSGNSKFVEEAKKKFQSIQQAYSVLSDANKRFLYDVGVYDSDEDQNGMGDFLDEMATMMSQTKPNENGDESFEQLQELFEEIFQGDMDSFGSSPQVSTNCSTSSSAYSTYSERSSSSNKRNSSNMNNGRTEHSSGFDSSFQSFCLGVEQLQDVEKGRGVQGGTPRGATSRRRYGKKQKVSTGHDVSSDDYSGISAS